MAIRASALFRPPIVLQQTLSADYTICIIYDPSVLGCLCFATAFPHQLICATGLMADLRDRRLGNLPDS